jgi:hypothetical protein
MKKAVYLLVFSLFFIALIYSYKHSDCNVLEATVYKYDMSDVVQRLNYDPHITIYPSTAPRASTDQVTVYVHGWCENQESIPFLKANSSLLPETVIGFNFQDSIQSSAKLFHFPKANFCQTDDIASLVMVLKVLDDCQISVFHLFGTERGAGTIVTAIARLMDYDHHKKFFKHLKLSRKQIDRIL